MNSDLKEGSKVGKYVLETYLGGGSFGAVWRCHDETTGDIAAIKLLTGALSSSETAAMRAEVEMLAAFAASRSVHVVNIIGGGPEPIPHVVMEYIEGTDFQTLLKDGSGLTQEQTIEAGIAIADALRALNEAGIIHRDIKPANVMLDKRGVIKLTDFGIAKIVGYETMTMTGQAAMTMAYAAPEIWDEGSAFGRPSHKSDLYAVGVLLFQCLTGQTPFRGNYGALYKAHTERPPDIRALPAATPPSMRALIAACLQKKQEDRPANAEAALLLLERAQVELQERNGQIPEHEPAKFGPWLRGAIHESMPWAWRARHESTGEEATVEMHFADSLDYGGQLRKAAAANSSLVPLGAERLIETNRLLMRPDERWTAAPAGDFQFWVAREDREVEPAARVTPAVLATAAVAAAGLIDAATSAGVGLSLKDNLTVLPDGGLYLRRPALDIPRGNSEIEALELIRALPLDPEAARIVSSATGFRSLVQTLDAPVRGDETAILGGPDQTVIIDQAAGQTVVIGTNVHEPEPAASPVASGPVVAAPAISGGAVAAPVSIGAVRMELHRIQARAAQSEYELSLRNHGDKPIELRLDAFDRSEALAYSMPRNVMLLPGANERVKVWVSAKRRRWLGGKRTSWFTVAASGGSGGAEPPITAEGEFDELPSKMPLFAGGLFGLAGLAVAAAIATAGGGGDDGGNVVAQAGETPTPVVEAATPVPPPVLPIAVEPAPAPVIVPEPAPAPPPVVPPPAPPVQQPQVVAPPTATPVPPPPPPPPPTQRPAAPSVSVTCTSSGGTASAGPDQQATQLRAAANELVRCTATINGSYESIAWAGGQVQGSGTSFSVGFTLPTNTIRLQVNWGGNPVIKNITVNVVGGSCAYQPGTTICVN